VEVKKGQTGGLITGLVFGVASLVIGVIIAFVIVSTLIDAGLLDGSRTTVTVTNETSTVTGLNSSGYTLTGVTTNSNYVPGSFVISEMRNGTAGDGTVISSDNYTVSDNGLVTNATVNNWNNTQTDYIYLVKSLEEKSTEDLNANFTKGVDNISGKIPTVLLVAAIVLILSVLAILVGVWQKMRMGGGSTL